MNLIIDDFTDFNKNFQINIRKNLLLEEVYVYDVFEKIIEYFKTNLILFNKEYLKLTYNEFIELFPKNWKPLKFFDKNKILYVSTINDPNEIKCIHLSKEEINEIKNEFDKKGGFFASDLNVNKNIGLLGINSNTDFNDFVKIAVHELIHFFQWETGKSIYNFLQNKDLNISNKDLNEISLELKIPIEQINNIYEKIGNAKELEAYVNNVYYGLKKFLKKHNIKFTKLFLSMILECFEHKNNSSFKDYINEIHEYLNNAYLDYNDLKNELGFNFIFLVLFCFRNQGFNSFKNHLYGYFEKEIKNKTIESNYNEGLKRIIRHK